MKHPYPVPNHLPPTLERVLAYWNGLRRGQADMPFADDLVPTNLPDLRDQLLLIDVSSRPERFRLSMAGRAFGERALAEPFLDEADPHWPLEFLRSQCAATVEARSPTCYRHEAEGGRGYARLLLPMWGDGRLNLLLGATDFD